MPEIDIASWLNGQKQKNSVMIILNQPVATPELFDLAWNSCEHHVVADGAAKHLRALNAQKYIPDFIVGDLDSISESDLEFYKQKDVKLLTRKSQESTDFMKAMASSHEEFDNSESPVPRTFFAFGGVGGRLDHTWSSFLCLNVAANNGDRLFLISEKNITLMLSPGEHTVTTPRTLFGQALGYVPLEGTCCVSTKGLMWDVEDTEFSFTTRLSTSNYLVSDEVWFKTKNKIMVTVEIANPR